MRLNILTISCLLAQATASTRIQKRWLNGDAATGTTDPDVTDNCEFWANDISSTDTCAELESYFDASITELHAWNPSLLEDYCVLIEGWSYCVEGPAVTTTAAVATGTAVQVVSFHEVSDFVTSTTAASTPSSSGTATTTAVTATYSGGIPSPTQSGLTTSCTKYYYVENGDTCYTIQDLYLDFTLNEFYSWNPSISSGCVGLEIGYYVCVDAGVSTSATATASTSTSPYEPQQTGIVSTCDEYYYVNEGDSCSEILEDYDITLAEFYSWNPSVGSTCSGMEYGYYVCVGIQGSNQTSTAQSTTASATTTTSVTVTSTTSTGVPTQTGIASDCVTYYEAVSGDSCWSIVTNDYQYLTEAEFIDMNPAVGSDCSGLWVGYDYCVATTSIEPMPGIISTCDSYYLVALGDSCYSIEQAYSITAAEFVEWNPDVGSSCASLWEGYYVCVGVSS